MWITINFLSWVAAYVLAELIPFFNSFLGIMSSVFWSTFLFLACWFYIWRHQHDYHRTWRNRLGLVVALLIIGIAGFFLIAGTWAVAVSIRDLYNAGKVGGPFECSMPV